MADDSPIAIIGAGVIGLTAALAIQNNHPHMHLSLIASEFPDDPHPSADYASAWAGAHYRPIAAGDNAQLLFEADLARRTADVMLSLADECPECGVGRMKAVEFLERPPPEVLGLRTGDVYAFEGDQFRVLDSKELPVGVRWGCKYDTYCVNVPVYCNWMMRLFVERGGVVLRRRLASAREAFEVLKRDGKRVRTVVNCSGRNFDRDPKMKIIRGQTVLVKQPYHATKTWQHSDGSWTFLIARPGGGTIVGGTKEIGDAEDRARPETTAALLKSAAKCFPDFVSSADTFETEKINVGRRPWREGGVKLEVEYLDADQTIIHSYGLGGRGYELSHGVAQRVVELFEQSKAQVQRPGVKASL